MKIDAERTLGALLGEYGYELCRDVCRCEALLRDYMGAYQHSDEFAAILAILRIPAFQVLLESAATADDLSKQIRQGNATLARPAGQHGLWAVAALAQAIVSSTPQGPQSATACPQCNSPQTWPGLCRGQLVTCPSCLEEYRLSHLGEALLEPKLVLIDQMDLQSVRAGASRTVLEGPTLLVAQDGSGDFRSLEEAVAQAPDGAKLVLRAGTYTTNMVLSRRVHLVAEGALGTVILMATRQPCLLVQRAEVTLRGLVLQADTRDRLRRAHVVEVADGTLVMEDCDVHGVWSDSIDVHGPSSVLRGLRCQVTSSRAGAIYAWNQSKVELEQCHLTQTTGPGLKLLDAQARLRYCKVADGRYCGIVAKGGTLVMEDCQVSGHLDAGIQLNHASISLLRCRVTANRGRGIWAHGASSGRIVECTLTENRGGALSTDAASLLQVLDTGAGSP